MTTTRRPSRVRKYAEESPAMPAPTMQTSHEVFLSSGRNVGGSCVAIHTETVLPLSGFMPASVPARGRARQRAKRSEKQEKDTPSSLTPHRGIVIPSEARDLQREGALPF